MAKPALSTLLPPEMEQLEFRPLFLFELDVAPASAIGKTPGVDRKVAELMGGRFEGERLRGTILTGGSDWQTVRTDGAWMLNVRCVMETDDGALITMQYRGIRHGPKEVLDRIAAGETVNPTEYYMRATPYFETSSEKYNFLNLMTSVAYGHRLAGGPIYSVLKSPDGLAGDSPLRNRVDAGDGKLRRRDVDGFNRDHRCGPDRGSGRAIHQLEKKRLAERARLRDRLGTEARGHEEQVVANAARARQMSERTDDLKSKADAERREAKQLRIEADRREKSATELETEANKVEGSGKRARGAAARHDERAAEAKRKLEKL